jgi:hypothetical protein
MLRLKTFTFHSQNFITIMKVKIDPVIREVPEKQVN